MKRFLFVVPPLAGHVNPTISLARVLLAKGHKVAWVAHPRRVRPLLPEDAELIALDDGVSDEVWRPVLERSRHVRGLASFEFLWDEVLLPLARGMLAGVEEAIGQFNPDVVVADHQAIAGALAARKHARPWATLCTTSASVVDPIADLPLVKEWVAQRLAELQTFANLSPIKHPDLSPHRVIVFSTEDLVGNDAPFPEHYRFVGPSLSDRPDPTPFPWEALTPGPRIFVSLGTVSADGAFPFYDTVAKALGNMKVQVILAAPPEALGQAPGNFLVQRRVPQLALLPHVQAVVCHAGHNTVCEALAHGLPLAVAPIRDDQPVIAGQVVRAGVGIRLKFGRLTPALLQDAVTRLLTDESYRTKAMGVRASFEKAGGAHRAAELLEAMLDAGH